jgi:hypothetical protein
MRLFIPPLGTKLVLTESWTFEIFLETRNFDFIRTLTGQTKEEVYDQWCKSWSKPQVSYLVATFQPGTKLVVDRIYIRKGCEGFDSVTFRIEEVAPEQRVLFKKKKGRFWVKLPCANDIECTVVDQTQENV